VNEREFCRTAKIDSELPKVTAEKVETDGGNEQHIGVLKDFADRILKGTPLVAEGYEGINSLTLSNALYLSSWLDKKVNLPLDEDLFLEELKRFDLPFFFDLFDLRFIFFMSYVVLRDL
jgi:hypothetical protein